MHKISAIIVNWQNIQDTINCVKSIRDTCDIVVVNNGGSSLNRQFPSQIHLIQNETNYGFARANNQGIKYAMDRFSPDYILLLNADTIALSGFLAPLVSLMELDNKIAIVQPKILRLGSTDIIDSAGQIAYKYGSVRDIGTGEKDGPLFQERKEVFGACAAAALYRTSALKNAGLFDEKLFSLFEDVDLSWRLRLKGYSVFYEPLSVVHHQRGVSGKLTAKNKIIRRFYGFRNCLTVTLKYYPLSSVLIFLPVHIYRLLIALFFKYQNKIKDPLFMLIFDSIKERTIIQKSVLIKTIQEKWINPAPSVQGIKLRWKYSFRSSSPQQATGFSEKVRDKIKILHIYNDYYPPVFGGIEKHINMVCEGLKDRFKMQALVSSRKPYTETVWINNIRVVKVSELGRFQSMPFCPTMPLWLKELDCDILHFHTPCPIAMLSYFFARPKGKVIVTYHSDVVRQKWATGIYGPLLIKFLKTADKIIAASPNYIDSSVYLNGFRDKCAVIPYGIDLSRFKEGVSTGPEILFVGKLRYYKGLGYLLNAMQNINAELNLIGTGNEEKKLKALANKLNLSHKIHFLGDISDEILPDYYSKCKVFVLPSTERSEAFGISQVEAMASGKPVVSTNINTGVPWVNQNNVTGITVPPKDPKALADAINLLLENKTLCEQLGRNGRKMAEERFAKETMLNKLEDIYRNR